jgi:hypothetical protein
MSMYETVVRVSPAAFAAIRKKPELLEGVFDDDEAVLAQLGLTAASMAGFDYIAADEMMDALDELDEQAGGEGGGEGEDDGSEDEEDDDAVYRDLCADGRLDYDAGYGPAFTLSPKAVKKAIKSSASIELDADVKAVFGAAAEAGDYIVGIVS